ncbi:ACSF2 [Branchiostoma lanceolatum]|nr:ACSF2 [Branchiostoma lanceolatum]
MSIFRGAVDDPLMEVTFGQLLDDTAARWPDREAYVFKKTGQRVTYADLQKKASKLAAGLKAIGTTRGDVVAWLFEYRPEWVYLYFAVAKLGAIAFPLKEERLGRNVEVMYYALKKAGVKILIMGDISGVDQTDDTIPYLCSLFPEVKTVGPGMLQIKRLPTLTSVVLLESKEAVTGVYTLEEVERMGNDDKLLVEVRTLQDQLSCHDTFRLLLTSGSTGHPKCAEQSMYSLYNNICFKNKALRMPNKGTVLHPCLLWFDVMWPFVAGFTIVVPANRCFSSSEILKTMQEERCHSIVSLYVKECHRLLHDPHLGDYDLSSLERVIVGGNVTPKSLLDRAAKVLPNAKISVNYGATEFISVAVSAVDMTGEGRGSTVGKIFPHTEVQLVDKDGQVVPLGHEGELWVRGHSVFKGYRGDAEKTSKAMTTDGFYKTGDVCILDENGVLKIVGRVSDMIIRDGYNVYPAAAESPLLKHPKVYDVRVTGVPDPISVEEVCACVILKEGQTTDSQELKKFCAEIEMVPIDRPGYLVFMDAFPLTSTQCKVDRKRLRLIAMEKLGLKEEA